MGDFIKEHSTAILIFGTFNPVTMAHVNMGLKAGEMIPESDVIYIPAKDEFLRNWKGFGDDSILKGRIDLLEKVARRYGFKVCHAETDGIVDGRTIYTVDYIRNDLGYSKIYLCMGTDKVGELGIWYRGEELISQNRFIVFERGATSKEVMNDMTRRYAANFTFVKEDDKYVAISATEVRKAMVEDNLPSIRDSVPEDVYEFLTGQSRRVN